uniref:Uncharacterized protein n=1 Tax=Cacopsylla melanoneura TaxID=428564 RepID=A0A8D9E862_9HEMI
MLHFFLSSPSFRNSSPSIYSCLYTPSPPIFAIFLLFPFHLFPSLYFISSPSFCSSPFIYSCVYFIFSSPYLSPPLFSSDSLLSKEEMVMYLNFPPKSLADRYKL